ncbi:MAG: hypothetical protein GX458_09945 [Phyllobacteriaceae bacterium]|nr:hypothetical protein [Phyllobacteriaceae bacterium]
MRKTIVVLLLAGVATVAANLFLVTLPAFERLSADPRNAKILIVPHLRWGIDPTTLVIDLWRVDGTAAMVDVDRCLLDVAAALKDRDFTRVELAHRTSVRFQMSGSYFKTLGTERDWQNPVYTMRTMPENMQTPDGLPAFERWSGGMLGVLGKQIDDHNALHRRWYFDEL